MTEIAVNNFSFRFKRHKENKTNRELVFNRNCIIYRTNPFTRTIISFEMWPAFSYSQIQRQPFDSLLLKTILYFSSGFQVHRVHKSDWNSFYELSRTLCLLFTYVNCCHSKNTSNRKITFNSIDNRAVNC